MCVCIFNCDFRRRKRGGNQDAPATQLAEQNQRRKKGPSVSVELELRRRN